MNTSSCVDQCANVFSIIGLFNYPLNEADCPPVIYTVHSPIMPSEGIYTLMRIHYIARLSALIENKINTIRGIDTVSRVEIFPAEHELSC